MKCPSCGTANTVEAEKCISCGTVLASAGDSTISFPLTPPGEGGETTIPAARGLAELVIAKGPGTGQHHAIDKHEIWIGRDPESDIFLNDVTVSCKHARIDNEGAHYYLSDVGSLNGTYLNGERVDKAELRHGDELWIGKYKMIFVRGS